MPLVTKICVRCGGWIARSRRKINSLCGRCIKKVNDSFKYSLARQRKELNRQKEE